MTTFRFIYNHFTNRKYRIRANNSYSVWEEIIFGILHGLILGLALFNIFPEDSFSPLNNLHNPNFADETTPNTVSNNIDNSRASLEHCLEDLL